MKQEDINNGKFGGCAIVTAFTLVWFFIGGFMSWGPLLSHGADERPILSAIVTWVVLWFTAIWHYKARSQISFRVFSVNLIVWALFVGWAFYDIGL